MTDKQLSTIVNNKGKIKNSGENHLKSTNMVKLEVCFTCGAICDTVHMAGHLDAFHGIPDGQNDIRFLLRQSSSQFLEALLLKTVSGLRNGGKNISREKSLFPEMFSSNVPAIQYARINISPYYEIRTNAGVHTCMMTPGNVYKQQLRALNTTNTLFIDNQNRKLLQVNGLDYGKQTNRS